MGARRWKKEMVRSQPGPAMDVGKMSKKESEDVENSLLICDNDKPNAVCDKRPMSSLDKEEKLLRLTMENLVFGSSFSDCFFMFW